MKEKISPIIHPNELLAIYQNDNIIIIDASNSIGSKEKYLEKHLNGALYIDLNKQLADIKEDVSFGGRHPLPTPFQFTETISKLGINLDSHVIVYDDKNGSNAAARFWWMLKSIGLEKVQVLDGGIQEALKLGFPTNSKVEIPKIVKPISINNWILPVANIGTIDKILHDENFLIIDVRDEARYNGEIEPIDIAAGHIPGAINIPFSTNLTAEGYYLTAKELREKYSKFFKDLQLKNVIIHCGSGVTACHSILAISIAGFEIPQLYVGSWSEWSRNDREIEKKVK